MSKTKNEKNTRLGKAATHLRLLVTGIAVTGGCGLLMLTDSAFNPAQREDKSASVKAAADVVSENEVKNAEIEKASASVLEMVQQEFLSELTMAEPKVKKMTFPKFKKAAIGEYDMSAAETKSKSVKVEGGSITDPDDFTVPFPAQDTLIYYPERGEPQNLTATRSVAGEYFRVHDENSGSTLVLNGHELLCLMVNNEIGDSWDEDAIKAQIVAAYTYLRFNQEHGLTPTIGLKYGYSSKLEGCVNAVEGQAMHYDGEIIMAVYSASSAGYTTTAKDIWGGPDYPYLKCVESIYDDQDVNWGVKKKFSKDEVKSMLESSFNIKLSDDQTKWFTIERAYSVVYIDSIIIDGRSDCKMTGIDLCLMMGLKSNAISIDYKDGEFTFTSCGWGHGVGMSQWGAHYYAENGWTYDQILTHYYVDATLEVSQPSEYSAQAPEENTDDSSAEGGSIGDNGEGSGDNSYAEPPADGGEYGEPQTGYGDNGEGVGNDDSSAPWTETTAPEPQWPPDTETDQQPGTEAQWPPETQWPAENEQPEASWTPEPDYSQEGAADNNVGDDAYGQNDWA